MSTASDGQKCAPIDIFIVFGKDFNNLTQQTGKCTYKELCKTVRFLLEFIIRRTYGSLNHIGILKSFSVMLCLLHPLNAQTAGIKKYIPNEQKAAAASRGGWKPGGGRFRQVTLRSRKPNAKASRGAVGPASRDRGCRTPESDRSGGKKGGTTDAQLSVLLQERISCIIIIGGVTVCVV